jgi:hypothetical protein
MMVPRDNLDTTLQKRTDAIPSKRHVEHEEAHKGVFQFPFIQFSNLGFDRLLVFACHQTTCWRSDPKV